MIHAVVSHFPKYETAPGVKIMMRRLILLISAILLVAPILLVGIHRGLGRLLLEFPPLTRYVEHPPFSIPHFFVYTLLALLAMAILLRPSWFGIRSLAYPPPRLTLTALPWWGWAGLALNVTAWVFAWGQFPWLGILKDHMFFPLWLGYILLVDGLVYRRTGSSWIVREPVTFVALFPASAISWWYFEFINRFVQNWYYAGVEEYSPTGYFLMATLSFSTVFPAVFETWEYLMGFQWFRTSYRRGPRHRQPSRPILVALMLVGTAGFVALGYFPVHLFALTWILPMLVLAPALDLAGVKTPLHHLVNGDYTELFTLALASLICGFFWEMWNFYSMPKWHYTVPYVQALHIFEMPLPGFAGFLPFGPICWMMWLTIKRLFRPRRIIP